MTILQRGLQSIIRPLFIIPLLLMAFPAAPTQAQVPNVFTNSIVINDVAGADAVNHISTDGHDGEVGIGYKLKNSDRVGFAIGNATLGFHSTTNDISGAATALSNPEVVKLGGTKWGMAASNVGSSPTTTSYWLSTDDGATWVNKKTFTGNTLSSQLHIHAGNAVGLVYAAFRGDTSAVSVAMYFQKSTDYGTTWSTKNRIDDSDGSPGGQGTGAGDCPTDVTVGGVWGNGQYVKVFFACKTGANSGLEDLLRVTESADNGGFFSRPGLGNVDTSFCDSFSDAYTHDKISVHGASFPEVAYRAIWHTSGCNGSRYHVHSWSILPNQIFSQGVLIHTGSADCNAGAGPCLETPGSSPIGMWSAVDNNAAGQSAMLAYVATNTNGGGLTTPILYYKEHHADTTWTQVYAGTDSDTGIGAVTITNNKVYLFHANQAASGQLQVVTGNVVAAVGSVASVAVTNLVGFDVDIWGNTVIARTNAGSTIRSYDGNGLNAALGGVVSTTNCARTDGVAALYSVVPVAPGKTVKDEYLTYVDCDATSHLTTSLHIRNAKLAAPRQPFQCFDRNDGNSFQTNSNNGPFCSSDILNNNCYPLCIVNNNILLPNSMGQLGSLATVRWDWSQYFNNPTGCDPQECKDYVNIAWAYTDSASGKVGVFAVSQNNDNPDSSKFVEEQISSTTAPPQLCTWSDPTLPQDHMAAVASDVATRDWAIGVTADPSGFGLGNRFFQPTPYMDLQSIFGNLYNNAEAISCQDGLAAIATNAGNLYVIDIRPGGNTAPIFGPVPIQANTGTVALTHNLGKHGQFVAGKATNGNENIWNITSGQLVSSISPPAGAIVGVEFDFSGQSMWIATSANIARYDVHTLTTGHVVNQGVIENQNGTVTCFGIDSLPSSTCNGISDYQQGLIDSSGQGGPTSGVNGLGGIDGTPSFLGISVHTQAVAAGISDGAMQGLDAMMVLFTFGAGFAILGAGLSKGQATLPLAFVGTTGGFLLDLYFALIPLWIALSGIAAVIGLFVFLKNRGG